MELSLRIQILENTLRMNYLSRAIIETYPKEDLIKYELELIKLATQLDRYLIITQGFHILDNYLKRFLYSKNVKFRKFIKMVHKVLQQLQTIPFELSDFDQVLIPQSKEEYIEALHEYLLLDKHPKKIIPLLPKLKKIESQFNKLIESELYNKSL